MKRIHYILFVFAAFTVISSCQREETRWQTQWKVPIAEGRLNLSNLVNDTLLQSDANGLVHVVYEDQLTNFNLDTLVRLPDTLIRESYSPSLSGGPFEIPAGFNLVNQVEETEYDLGEAQMRKLRIKSGMISVSMKNYVNGTIDMEYDLTSAVGPSGPLSYSITAEPGSPSSPTVYEENIDISGYEIDLTGEDGNSFNTIAASFQASTNADAGSTEIYGYDSVAVDLQFSDVVVEYAKGYFGQYEEIIRDTINFEVFENVIPGAIQLEEASIDLQIKNYVGMDARVTFNELRSIRNSTSANISLEHQIIGEPINITRATDNNGTVVPTENNYQLDQTNSNIVEFVEVLPNQLIYDLDLILNPLDDVSLGNDFIYTDQPLEANLLMDIPLCISIDNITLVDTLELTNDRFDENADGTLFLSVTNGFPFSADIQLDLIDAGGENISTVGEGNIAAAMQEMGEDYEPVESEMEISITQEIVSQLNRENNLVVRVTLNTSNYPEMIKLRDSYFMDVSIGGDINYEVTVD